MLRIIAALFYAVFTFWMYIGLAFEGGYALDRYGTLLIGAGALNIFLVIFASKARRILHFGLLLSVVGGILAYPIIAQSGQVCVDSVCSDTLRWLYFALTLASLPVAAVIEMIKKFSTKKAEIKSKNERDAIP